MSNFLRDLAIAKFPKFGITYYIQCAGEPSVQGNNVQVWLKFYDGKTTPPQHLMDKNVKMPLWKWGEMLEVIEDEAFSDHPTIVAVELTRRRPDDQYGRLEVRLDHQVQLDSNQRDARAGEADLTPGPPAPQEQEGPSKPAVELPNVSGAAVAAKVEGGSERGQPQAGGELSDADYGNPKPFASKDRGEPPAACSHPPLERIVLHAGTDVLVYDCGVCGEQVTELKDRCEVKVG